MKEIETGKPVVFHDIGKRTNQEDAFLVCSVEGIDSAEKAEEFLKAQDSEALKVTEQYEKDGSCAIRTVYVPKTKQIVWSNLGDSQATVFIWRNETKRVEAVVLNKLHTMPWQNPMEGHYLCGMNTYCTFGNEEEMISYPNVFSHNSDYGTRDISTFNLAPKDRLFLMTSCDGFFETYAFNGFSRSQYGSQVKLVLNILHGLDEKYSAKEQAAALYAALSIELFDFKYKLDKTPFDEESLKEAIKSKYANEAANGTNPLELFLQDLTQHLTVSLKNRSNSREMTDDINPLEIYREKGLTTKSYEKVIAGILSISPIATVEYILTECSNLAKSKSEDNLTAIFTELTNIPQKEKAIVAEVFDGHGRKGRDVSDTLATSALETMTLKGYNLSNVQQSEKQKPKQKSEEQKTNHRILIYGAIGLTIGLGTAYALYCRTAMPKEQLGAVVVVSALGGMVLGYICDRWEGRSQQHP